MVFLSPLARETRAEDAATVEFACDSGIHRLLTFFVYPVERVSSLGNGILRQLLLIAAAIMLVLGPGAPAWAKQLKLVQTLEAKTGEIVFFKLPGDPSVGYKWRLNTDLSKGLDLVTVEQIGWLIAQKGQSMFFQQEQSKLNIAVRTLAAGQVDLAFDYYRRFGGRIYTTTSVVRVIIKPQLATQ